MITFRKLLTLCIKGYRFYLLFVKLLLKINFRCLESVLNQVVQAQATEQLVAEPNERNEDRKGYREVLSIMLGENESEAS